MSGTMKELLKVDFGAPLHSFVICGELHCVEEEMFEVYRVGKSNDSQQASS